MQPVEKKGLVFQKVGIFVDAENIETSGWKHHNGRTDYKKILEAVGAFANVRIQGLMTIPPFTEDPQQARPYFRRVRELRDTIAKRNAKSVSMDVLSMGLSHDFEVAIEEGSTCVRVGAAIFGQRHSN